MESTDEGMARSGRDVRAKAIVFALDGGEGTMSWMKRRQRRRRTLREGRRQGGTVAWQYGGVEGGVRTEDSGII
jgi:hypothetical protein